MPHVDEGTIHAWLDGALPATEASRVEQHVAGCASCAGAVAEARGLIAASSRILTALDDAPRDVLPGTAGEPHDPLTALRARHESQRDGKPVRGLPRAYLAAAAVVFVALGTAAVVWRSGFRVSELTAERTGATGTTPPPGTGAGVTPPASSAPAGAGASNTVAQPPASTTPPTASRRVSTQSAPRTPVPPRATVSSGDAGRPAKGKTALVAPDAAAPQRVAATAAGGIARPESLRLERAPRAPRAPAAAAEAMAARDAARTEGDAPSIAGCYRLRFPGDSASPLPALVRLSAEPVARTLDGVWYGASAVDSTVGRPVTLRWRPASDGVVIEALPAGVRASAENAAPVRVRVRLPRTGAVAAGSGAPSGAQAQGERIACPTGGGAPGT